MNDVEEINFMLRFLEYFKVMAEFASSLKKNII